MSCGGNSYVVQTQCQDATLICRVFTEIIEFSCWGGLQTTDVSSRDGRPHKHKGQDKGAAEGLQPLACHSTNSFLPDSAFVSVHGHLRCQEKGSSVSTVTKDPQAVLSLAGWTVLILLIAKRLPTAASGLPECPGKPSRSPDTSSSLHSQCRFRQY